MREDQEVVEMISPVTGGVGRATRNSFKKVWQPKGWKLVEEGSADEGPVDLEGETKARLLEIAAERGIEVASSATKADVLTALKGEDS